MNFSIIRYILCYALLFESFFLGLSCIVALLYQEDAGMIFAAVMSVCFLIGFLGTRKKPKNKVFYAKEGFVTVSLSWILLSIVGALPFTISGEIPAYEDALFEIISGFTTTGASILSDVESLSHCMLFWRSFSQWIGGMGVLVFILAILPLAGSYNMHLMRAESPGPSVGKLVPRVRHTAMILYSIYFFMTIVQVILLLIAGMPLFDSFTLSFATAGTGGFGIANDSMGSYSLAVQTITTIFMILFSINFNVYYLILIRKIKQAFKCEEVRYYLILIACSIFVITINIRNFFPSLYEAFHHTAFQVASIISTTGYSTVDFNLWPSFSKTVLVLLMFVGACAGSSGGGFKISRVLILLKSVRKQLSLLIHPRTVKKINLDGHTVAHETIRAVNTFFFLYVCLFFSSLLILSLDNFDFTTNFTAVAATINNIGPGLELVGPTSNFSFYSPLSKCVLMLDMLAGRLELFPILVLFNPGTWKRT